MNETLYRNLLNHMNHHDVRGWLLEGCKREDANTIHEAVREIDEATLKRRLARALAKDR